MATKVTHKWAFKPGMRAGAYSWKSSTKAVERLKSASAEIRAVARTNPTAAAEGVIALHRMMEGREPGLAHRGEAPSAADETELRSMMRDPRYWRTREPDFVRRVTDGFRRLVNSAS